MSGIVKKSFNNPDEVRSPDKANVHVCDLGGVAAAKMVLQPGWSWSTCIKPVVGGESCQASLVLPFTCTTIFVSLFSIIFLLTCGH